MNGILLQHCLGIPFFRVIVLFAFLAMSIFLASGCSKPKEAPPPPVVEVMTVIQKDVPVYKEWIGTIDGLVNATIRAQVQGYLIKQDYRDGDVVKKGQVLFDQITLPSRQHWTRRKDNWKLNRRAGIPPRPTLPGLNLWRSSMPSARKTSMTPQVPNRPPARPYMPPRHLWTRLSLIWSLRRSFPPSMVLQVLPRPRSATSWVRGQRKS